MSTTPKASFAVIALDNIASLLEWTELKEISPKNVVTFATLHFDA